MYQKSWMELSAAILPRLTTFFKFLLTQLLKSDNLWGVWEYWGHSEPHGNQTVFSPFCLLLLLLISPVLQRTSVEWAAIVAQDTCTYTLLKEYCNLCLNVVWVIRPWICTQCILGVFATVLKAVHLWSTTQHGWFYRVWTGPPFVCLSYTNVAVESWSLNLPGQRAYDLPQVWSWPVDSSPSLGWKEQCSNYTCCHSLSWWTCRHKRRTQSHQRLQHKDSNALQNRVNNFPRENNLHKSTVSLRSTVDGHDVGVGLL